MTTDCIPVNKCIKIKNNKRALIFAVEFDQFCTFILKGSEKKREKLSSSVRAVRKGIESKSQILIRY